MLKRSWFRTHQRLTLAATIMAAPIVSSNDAEAQDIREFQTPLELTRPGYESKNIRLGRFIVAPELEISQTYDSNIFAQNDNVEDDFITRVTPRVAVTTDPGKFNLSSSFFATANRFVKNSSDSTPTFGVDLGSSYAINPANTIGGGISYVRRIETREEEPELANDRKIVTVDDGDADIFYGYRRNRVGVAVRATGRRVDFDESEDNDLDRWEYGGSVRGSYLVSPRFDAFVEPSILRRDFDAQGASVNASGETVDDVDSTTLGILFGTGVDIADKWSGQIGLGAFHVINDGNESQDFTGLGVQTALTWSITPRTAVSGSVSRQDVASITGGAAGRVDTRVGFSLEQEVRHNILLTAETGVVVSEFEDSDESDLITPAASVSARYLVNRYFSLFGALGYSQRFANDQSDEEFNRFFSTLGLTVRL